MMLCCGCKKDQHASTRTQILDPSVSNNFLYQQHLQLHQQQQQQHLPQQSNLPLLATTPTVASLAVGGGGQQRYVGGLNYVMQQQHPNYQNQLLVNNANNNLLTPSRSYSAVNQHPPPSVPPNVFTNQPSLYSSSMLFNDGRSRMVPDMVLQSDSFRRVSGISSEVFRQIEAVEAQFDPSTLAAQYAEMERRGEMIIRILNPTAVLPAWLEDTIRRYGDGISLPSWVQFVEIIKRPGQTLGLYIREGDAIYTTEGVYISRIALESPVYQSGCLRVGDEILAINMVDVQRMSLDDVVIIMSIPRRLILTIRSRPLNATEHMLPAARGQLYGHAGLSSDSYYDTVASDIYSRVDELRKPVVVLKQQLNSNLELDEEEEEDALAAATAAAEAGLLDDPSAAAAAAVAALNNPTPSAAAAAVAAVNELNATRQRSGSLDIYDLDIKSRTIGASRSLSSKRKLFANTADNLAELYHQSELDPYYSQSAVGRRRSGSLAYDGGRPSSRLSTGTLPSHFSASKAALLQQRSHLLPDKHSRNSASLLYHGRLASARSRSSTGRLLRTSSEQMLLPDHLDPHSDPLLDPLVNTTRRLSLSSAIGGAVPEDQLDYFLQRYNTLRQMQKRHHSLDRSGIKSNLRNSFSSQTLGPLDGYQRRLEAMGIPLPAMAEAAARSRRRKGSSHIDSSFSDTESSLYDMVPRRAITPSLSSYGARSSSLPRAGMAGIYGASGRTSMLNQRLQQLEHFYNATAAAKMQTLNSAGRLIPNRPHSAIGNYHSDREDDTESVRIRRNLGLRYLQQRQPVTSATSSLTSSGLDTVRREEDASLEKKISRVPSTSAIYETIRKSKMAQDMTQPHSGSLMSSDEQTSISGKHRLNTSSLNRYKSKEDYSTRHIKEFGKSKDSDLHDYDMLNSSSAVIPPARSNSTSYLGGTMLGAPSDRPNRPLMIDPSGFQQYGPEMRSSHRDEQSVAGYSGLLVIHLLGVRGLQLDSTAGSQSVTMNHQPDSSATSQNLYSVVECDRVYKARTIAVQSHDNNSTNFDWDEIFDIDLFETKEVTFLFYTWNPSSRHKLCSKGTIHLPWISTLRSQHVHAFEMRLYETPGAMLYIKLEFHDLTTTFKRTKKDPKPVRRGSRVGSLQIQTEQPLFGVDLDTILSRENSGFSVPILVKRCTEEIERRGLHLVGIYRLCGSAIRKRHLRENFEKNAWLADLSVESVPDINVITSLLKDYLRELPEPLFNKALFDMMGDGLSVCVPDDPSGNAKLMFSILECLSKANRNTVLYLMDHIKLIHINADRNKMTSQALAICFGPLFSCHSESESVHKAIQVFKFLLDIWPNRRGSFNFMRKLDDLNKNTDHSSVSTTPTVMPPSSTTPASIAKSPLSNRIGSDLRNVSQSDLTTKDYSNYGSSRPTVNNTSTVAKLNDPPSSVGYRFSSSNTSVGGPNYSSPIVSSGYISSRGNSLVSGGTGAAAVPTTASSWSSSTGTASGSGRLLPSTQNATRTISAYSSSTNSVSQIKMPPGGSPLVQNPVVTTSHSSATVNSRSAIGGDISSYEYLSAKTLSSTVNTTTSTYSTYSSSFSTSPASFTATSTIATTGIGRYSQNSFPTKTYQSSSYDLSPPFDSTLHSSVTSRFSSSGISSSTTTTTYSSVGRYEFNSINTTSSVTTTTTTSYSRPYSSYLENSTTSTSKSDSLDSSSVPYISSLTNRRSNVVSSTGEALYSTVNKTTSGSSYKSPLSSTAVTSSSYYTSSLSDSFSTSYTSYSDSNTTSSLYNDSSKPYYSSRSNRYLSDSKDFNTTTTTSSSIDGGRRSYLYSTGGSNYLSGDSGIDNNSLVESTSPNNSSSLFSTSGSSALGDKPLIGAYGGGSTQLYPSKLANSTVSTTVSSYVSKYKHDTTGSGDVDDVPYSSSVLRSYSTTSYGSTIGSNTISNSSMTGYGNYSSLGSYSSMSTDTTTSTTSVTFGSLASCTSGLATSTNTTTSSSYRSSIFTNINTDSVL